MATEDEKKRNLLKLYSLIIQGLSKGLWDILGDAAKVTSRLIGVKNLEMLEKDMGFEIAGENPQDMMTELDRIFVDELGAMESSETIVEGETIKLICKNCHLINTTKRLAKDGIPPFICPFRGIAVAAMEKRLGQKTMLADSVIDTDKRVCVHQFDMI